MVTVLILLSLTLGITTLALTAKIHLMKKSAEEISRQFDFALTEETNALISISSSDSSMRNLAAEINRELRLLRKERRRYLRGDRELKEAITNISHDLRTPLTAICGYLDLLADEAKSDTACRYLALIQNRAEVLKRLTEELFRYSIVVSTKEDLQPETVAVDAVLADSIAASYSALVSKKITPAISLPEKKVLRVLDPGALARVFANLISNAVKYSDGDLTITMNEDCKITFTNTAVELSSVTAARLFDRFYTVETGRSSTGLGLAIAKVLTEEMGGKIDAKYLNQKLIIELSFTK